MTYQVTSSPTMQFTLQNGISPYMNTRGQAVIDFNGDSRLDILMNGSYFTQEPEFPFTAMYNQGNGQFIQSTLNTGGATQGNLTNRPLIADFNGDGYDDLFLGDSGLELGGSANMAAWTGHKNHLFLSDATAHGALVYSPNNLPAIVGFHHSVDMADIDGDGDKDIAVFKFPRANDTNPGQVYFLLNDGHGNFTYSTQGLPDNSINGLNAAAQNIGTIKLGDFNGDGRIDLITSSYANPTGGEQYTSTYIQTQSGSFIESSRAYWGQTFTDKFPSGAKYGVPNSVSADFDGDGDLDLIEFLESVAYVGPSNDGRSFIQAFQNDGHGNLTDTTVDWFGSYAPYPNGMNVPNGQLVSTIETLDFNRDGNLDLRLDTAGSGGYQTILLNDGTGHFSPLPSDIFGVASNSTQFFEPIDMNGDGTLDWLAVQRSGTYNWATSQWEQLSLTPKAYVAQSQYSTGPNGVDPRASGVYGYNEQYYLRNNPDVASAVAQGGFSSGLSHYMRYGQAEGRKGSSFDYLDYLANNHDVYVAFGFDKDRVTDHYLSHGIDEGRKTAFNASSYLAANPDVATATGGNPDLAAVHYTMFGYNEGRRLQPAASASFAAETGQPFGMSLADSPLVLDGGSTRLSSTSFGTLPDGLLDRGYGAESLAFLATG